MKTYIINKESEFIVDKGDYYLLNKNVWDGNLVIENLGKSILVKGDQVVEGYQIVEGDQVVEGDQRVEGYQIVEGDQRVEGYQRVEGDQRVDGYQVVKGDQVVEGYQIVEGDQRVEGYQIVEGDQRVEGYQIVEGNQIVKGNQIVEGNQIVKGYQIVNIIVKKFNCRWMFYISKNCLKIGCKEKTWEEWDEWFKGTEEFKTNRGTKEFMLIENGYRTAKEFKNIFNIIGDTGQPVQQA